MTFCYGKTNSIGNAITDVHYDLREGNKEAPIEFRETTGSCIRFEAATKLNALALITRQRTEVVYFSGKFGSTRFILERQI